MENNIRIAYFGTPEFAASQLEAILKPTGVSRASDKASSSSESGTDRPCSHLEIVCRTTFSLTASSSWERPFAFLIVLMFSLNTAKASFRRHNTPDRPVAASNAKQHRRNAGDQTFREFNFLSPRAEYASAMILVHLTRAAILFLF